MGIHQTKNGRIGKCKTTATVVAPRIGATARLFLRAFRPGRMLTCHLYYVRLESAVYSNLTI
ncbi:MAG: hypothetical protein O4860_09340 [Trichodesmium sp. St2_bin2_1]|nr:hypothetical protein [Trichodesmium sp. St2_bin2_1]